MAKRKQLGFRFEVGEVLAHKLDKIGQLFVIERLLRECEGGVQREYLCRSSLSVAVSATRFLESELTHLAKPRLSKTSAKSNVDPFSMKWDMKRRKLRRKKSSPAVRRKSDRTTRKGKP